MGAGMARRLLRAEIRVVGYDVDATRAAALADVPGFVAAAGIEELVGALPRPRETWLSLPAGAAVDDALSRLAPLLEPDDVVVDGGNSNCADSIRRAAALQRAGLHFVDAGISGGIAGETAGYCVMLGGEPPVVAALAPTLSALAQDPPHGWALVGGAGAGHFAKMVHNALEYVVLQGLGEAGALLDARPEVKASVPDVFRLWSHGSLVDGALLRLASTADVAKESLAPVVPDSGTVRWTVQAAIAAGVPTPAISVALQSRFASQSGGYAERFIALMRRLFGGHEAREGAAPPES
jgi:6-phosphogluconate dehydrogenase